jgi:glucose-6-phosphate dehydrogenase assembly protein OpcA
VEESIIVAASVKPERILKDLGKLWVDLGKQDTNGVLRACAMTLIVVVEEAHDAAAVGEMLAALMHEHPSRAIVLRVRSGEEHDLDAHVFAQCWMPFGQRQQICCEQIEILSSLRSFADVPPVIRGLVAPDLPVVLYCPSENLWWLRQFQALLPLVDKLILDSYGMRGSLRALEYLKSLAQSNRLRRADLAWSRLTPWRESIARIFDEPGRSRMIYDLSEIQIMYKDTDEPASVYYLAGWFMQVLGAGIKLNIAPGVGPEFASIVRVGLIGPRLDAYIELMDASTVEVRVNGKREQVTVYPPMTEYEALRQELTIAGRDPVFEDIIGLAHLLKGTA